jgi:alpha/beta superfamily hydrolase
MNNRISFTLYEAFRGLGFSTLRFNFRGVGKSQGKYDGGAGELNDACGALDFIQSINPEPNSLWVAGYSFGAWIGMQLLMRRPEVGGFVSIAPPANVFDFGFLAPCPANGLMIAGGQDTLVPEPSVAKMVAKLNLQKGVSIDYRVFEEADHFFTDQCEKISAATIDHVRHSLGMDRKVAMAAD